MVNYIANLFAKLSKGVFGTHKFKSKTTVTSNNNKDKPWFTRDCAIKRKEFHEAKKA